jgi:hypothetical protein
MRRDSEGNGLVTLTATRPIPHMRNTEMDRADTAAGWCGRACQKIKAS